MICIIEAMKLMNDIEVASVSYKAFILLPYSSMVE